MTVAVCFHRLGPYHHARLRAANSHRSVAAVEFCDVDGTYAWSKINQEDGFQKVTVFQGSDIDKKKGEEVLRCVRSALERLDPEVVVVPGWWHPGALAALHWCLAESRPAVLMSDSTQRDRPRYAWTEAIKRRVVRLYSAALIAGAPHRAYAYALGFSHNVIFDGYDVVDNDHFAGSAERARADASARRQRLGLPERFFLASGRFVEKKNLFRLLEAFARYRGVAGPAALDLVVLGDGELRPRLEAHRGALGLERHVHMPGFKQYDELSGYYGLAAAFVHASTTEQWGLVVNEAMASGLPVLVSKRCGCAPDLVSNGVNGYTFDPYGVEELASLMLKVASDECDREAMGRASEEIIREWGLERFADRLMRAVDAALSRRIPKASLLDKALLWGLIRR